MNRYFVSFFMLALLHGCSSCNTSVLVDEDARPLDATVPTDATVPADDAATTDASTDSSIDAETDAAIDAGFDTGVDASSDAGNEGAVDAGVDSGFDAGSSCTSIDAACGERCGFVSDGCGASYDCSSTSGVSHGGIACGGDTVCLANACVPALPDGGVCEPHATCESLGQGCGLWLDECGGVLDCWPWPNQECTPGTRPEFSGGYCWCALE